VASHGVYRPRDDPMRGGAGFPVHFPFMWLLQIRPICSPTWPMHDSVCTRTVCLRDASTILVPLLYDCCDDCHGETRQKPPARRRVSALAEWSTPVVTLGSHIPYPHLVSVHLFVTRLLGTHPKGSPSHRTMENPSSPSKTPDGQPEGQGKSSPGKTVTNTLVSQST
jgi:hypothetical protein